MGITLPLDRTGYLLYDSDCGICLAMAGFLAKRVTPERLGLLALTEADTVLRVGRLVEGRPLTTTIHFVRGDDTILTGARAALAAGHTCATDVTGFGLLGHLQVALAGSGVSARLDAGAVPFLDGARDLALRGLVPSGTRANLEFVSPHVSFGKLVEIERLLLADAQTSGGLLISVPEANAGVLEEALRARGTPVHAIGSVDEGPPGTIAIVGRLPATGPQE
jgi:hypothetical protein